MNLNIDNADTLVEERTTRTRVEEKKSPRKKKNTKWIVLFSIVGVLIIFRLFLPVILLNYVNKKLSESKQYKGEVKDIDVALIRGAYIIKDVNIVKKGGSPDGKTGTTDSIPFFNASRLDLSVEWSALFKGALVGEIYVTDPVLNFVKEAHKGEDVKADTADFRQLIKKLMPLTVNYFEINNGQIHYIDPNSSPRIDVALRDIEVIATNLSNKNKNGNLLPAHIETRGNIYNGKFTMAIDLNALNKVPTFDLNAELTAMDLSKMNDFFKAYGNFEINKGSFGLYTEMAARDGSYGGYVKPVIRDIEVKQGEGDLKDMVWELIVGGASKILTNPSKDQLATKVEIKGEFDSGARVNLWRAVGLVLRNAFIKALKPSIDNSINIGKLEADSKKTILEKVFGTGEKKKDKKNGKRENKKRDKKDKKNGKKKDD